MADRILVIRAGALGDVVLTVPALHGLRQRHPDARLTVVGYPTLWSLAGPLADEVVAIDSAHFATLFSPTLAPELRAWLAGFDRVIAWTARDLSPALTGILHASPYPPPGIHAAAWLRQTIGLPADRLALDSALAGWAEQANLHPQPRAGLIVIHPGASADWKRWPPTRFAALALALKARGYRVELVAGPADERAVAETLQHAKGSFPVIREPSPLRLAHRLTSASLYIGNDSGVTHLAAAAGVPTLALFGPTDPISWAPLRGSRVLRACTARTRYQGQIRVCEDSACLEALTVQEVRNAAIDMLAHRARV